jgi:hypothetical protein
MSRLTQTPFLASRVLQNRARLAPLHLPPQLNAGAGKEKTFPRTFCPPFMCWQRAARVKGRVKMSAGVTVEAASDRQEGERPFSCKITRRTQPALEIARRGSCCCSQEP